MIAALKADGDPLWDDYTHADRRAADTARMARSSGHFPLLSRGDINLYSLFVERAHALVKPSGMVGLLTPSGIASDLSASAFFRGWPRAAGSGRSMTSRTGGLAMVLVRFFPT
jgi:hypothetical protein